MAKYASCSRAHRSQKGMPRISTTAWRGQGRSVLLPTWHCPSFFVASVFSKSFTTTVRVLGAGNAGASKSTTPNDAAGTVSWRHLLSRSSLGACCFYYNYSTLLLLVLLYVVFGTATSLPEKCWGPMRSPGKVAPHNYSPAAPSRGTQLPSSRPKLCCTLEAEHGKEFWRTLFEGKFSCSSLFSVHSAP